MERTATNLAERLERAYEELESFHLVGDMGHGIEQHFAMPAVRNEIETGEESIEFSRDHPSSQQQELLAQAAVMDPDGRIRVAIVLPDPPFDWAALRSAEAQFIEREAVISVRRAQVARDAAPVIERLRDLGATNIVQLWIAPTISADIPAGAVNSLASWSDIIEISADTRPDREGYGAFGGEQARNGMRTAAFISAGTAGRTGIGGEQAAPCESERSSLFACPMNGRCFGILAFSRAVPSLPMV